MRLISTSFIRSVDGEFCLCTLRKGSIAILENATDFLRPMLIGEDAENTAKVLSRAYGVSYRDIYDDMEKFYRNLEELGLVEIREGHAAIAVPQYECQRNGAGSNGDEGCFSVEDFYMRHKLLFDLHVDLTDSCTERCVHCYVPHGQCEFLPYELAEKVLGEFREQQGLTVQLSGGECMLHPDFARICRLCRKLDLL